jgi:hypothetical protein
MAMAPRLVAPIAAPPPPKPPQLNLVASALMPDVDTDTLGPGATNLMASAGWDSSRSQADVAKPARRMWHKPPGDESWRDRIEHYNSLVAAVGVMDDPDMKQAEISLGTPPITEASLPMSVWPATSSKDRWQGGFAWAPENQYAGIIADPCGQSIDLPSLTPANGLGPVTGVVATPSNTGGTLTHAASPYSFVVVPVSPTGGQGAASAPVTATIASGISGSVGITWTGPSGATVAGYNVYGRFAGAYELIASVTGASFTDTGAATPTLQFQTGNLPQLGFIPFLIQVEDQASAWGWEARDYVGRALRLLDNATPNAIETEFWMGNFAQNSNTGPMYQAEGPPLNAFLQQTATASNGGTGIAALDLTPGTVPSITRATQILEDYLANSGFGGQGMLHVAPETSPNLLGARRVGSLLLTVMDNIVVPGSGYPTVGDTGPLGASNTTPPAGQAWMFATDLVSVRLGAPVTYPNTMAEALDRGNQGAPNMVRIRAQRYGAATWDGARLAACRCTLAA